jgi:hypothetical protein
MMRHLLLLAAAALGSAAQASLVWKETEVSLKPELGAPSAEAVFSFSNTGGTPVRVVQVSSSCGCTVPKLEKQVYAPGESGEIHAKFTVGTRQGVNSSSVTVITDDPASSRQTLRLVVDIPQAVGITPRVVYWNVGEEAAEKELEVVVHESLEAVFTEVRTTSEGFTAKVAPTDKPHVWRVTLRPDDTTQRRRGTFEIVSEKPIPGAGALTVFAFVR